MSPTGNRKRWQALLFTCAENFGGFGSFIGIARFVWRCDKQVGTSLIDAGKGK